MLQEYIFKKMINSTSLTHNTTVRETLRSAVMECVMYPMHGAVICIREDEFGGRSLGRRWSDNIGPKAYVNLCTVIATSPGELCLL
jgi:hypothetical protein